MSEDTIQRIVLRCDDLSPLPMIASRLLAASTLERTGPEEIAAILEGDPALCARALRLANGAGFAPVEPIESLQEACHRLGRQRVGVLAMNVAAYATYQPVGRIKPAEVDFLWRHAILGAVASAWFSERAGVSAERAHVAGLLQNVAFLALGQSERELSLRAAVRIGRGQPVGEVEQELLGGITHGALSARILESWGMQSELLEIIEAHSDSALLDGAAGEIVRCTRKGDALASAVMEDVANEGLHRWWTAQSLPAVAAEVGEMGGAREEVGLRALELLTLLG